MVECVHGAAGKERVERFKDKKGELGGCPFVQTKESVICRVTFSSLGRRGGFDRQDFLSFIRGCKLHYGNCVCSAAWFRDSWESAWVMGVRQEGRVGGREVRRNKQLVCFKASESVIDTMNLKKIQQLGLWLITLK